MQIVISLREDQGLDSLVSSLFERSPFFMFIDPHTNEFEIEENPIRVISPDMKVQVAQIVADKKPDAVISRRIGPQARSLFENAGISIYGFQNRNARQMLAEFQKCCLDLFA
jgi:predicted Fe-Mo cluster-binding NifX family protein